MSVITLTTDFGLRDHYVGVLKGVILKIDSGAVIVDISHEIPPHDIQSGAHVIANAWHYFPTGTIHVVVVDPGVGSEREIMALAADEHFFIAPDNGVLSFILDQYPQNRIRIISNENVMSAQGISRTFHGRDIMAPAAAHLSLGIRFEELGPEIQAPKRLPAFQPVLREDHIQGRVVYIDHFGNLVTNIHQRLLADRLVRGVRAGRLELDGLAPSYSAVSKGSYLALVGSTGRLEISVNMGAGRTASRPHDRIHGHGLWDVEKRHA